MVDNASEDRTVEVLQPLLDERVRVLRNNVNRGNSRYGAACSTRGASCG